MVVASPPPAAGPAAEIGHSVLDGHRMSGGHPLPARQRQRQPLDTDADRLDRRQLLQLCAVVAVCALMNAAVIMGVQYSEDAEQTPPTPANSAKAQVENRRLDALFGGSASTDKWAGVTAVLTKAVADGVFPGAVAAVAIPGSVVYMQPVGLMSYGSQVLPHTPAGTPVTKDTRFDMASCTKVLATTSAVALLVQRGILNVDMKVADPTLLGPAFAVAGKADITLRNLLLHNAGFPPDPVPGYWEPEFGCPGSSAYRPPLSFDCQDRIYASILNQTLAHPIGAVYVYSDLSMLTMLFVVGHAVKAHSLVPEDALMSGCLTAGSPALLLTCYYEAFVRTQVLQAIGMPSSGFLPPDSTWGEVAPTWNDTVYRHEVLQGIVSDENAYASGGIAGHAGLFSTAPDAVKLALAWLQPQVGGPDFLSATTISQFATIGNVSQSSRALGWDTNSYVADSYRGCGNMSSETYNHLGYTGTQVCIDPAAGYVTVLLTNRVYPHKFNNAVNIHRVRQAFNNAVLAVYRQCACDNTTPFCDCPVAPLGPTKDGISPVQAVMIALLVVLVCAAAVCWKSGAWERLKQQNRARRQQAEQDWMHVELQSAEDAEATAELQPAPSRPIAQSGF